MDVPSFSHSIALSGRIRVAVNLRTRNTVESRITDRHLCVLFLHECDSRQPGTIHESIIPDFRYFILDRYAFKPAAVTESLFINYCYFRRKRQAGDRVVRACHCQACNPVTVIQVLHIKLCPGFPESVSRFADAFRAVCISVGIDLNRTAQESVCIDLSNAVRNEDFRQYITGAKRHPADFFQSLRKGNALQRAQILECTRFNLFYFFRDCKVFYIVTGDKSIFADIFQAVRENGIDQEPTVVERAVFNSFQVFREFKVADIRAHIECF